MNFEHIVSGCFRYILLFCYYVSGCFFFHSYLVKYNLAVPFSVFRRFFLCCSCSMVEITENNHGVSWSHPIITLLCQNLNPLKKQLQNSKKTANNHQKKTYDRLKKVLIKNIKTSKNHLEPQNSNRVLGPPPSPWHQVVAGQASGERGNFHRPSLQCVFAPNIFNQRSFAIFFPLLLFLLGGRGKMAKLRSW